MKNFKQPAGVISVTVSADIQSGEPLLIGDILGIATSSYKNGETGEFAIEGAFEIEKVSTDVVTPGKILFWDNSAKKLTLTASTHKPVAIAIAGAGNGVDTVVAKLWPLTKDTDTQP